MAYRAQFKDKDMGPPAPERLRIPADSNEVPVYFMVAGLGGFVLFMGAGSLVYDHDVPLLPPAVAFGGAAMLAVLPLLLVWKAIKFTREGRVLDFRKDRLVISRQWLFGKPVEIPYDQVTAIESPRNAQVLHLAEGRVRLSVYTAPGHWMMAALELRVGHACAQRGEHEKAIEYYRSADYYFYPSLKARNAEHHEALDNLNYALDSHMLGVVEHEDAFGPDSPQVALLRERLDAFTQAHPEAELTASVPDIRARSKERRDNYSKHLPPQMRDAWTPVDA